MVIRRRLDSGLTKSERFEARDGGVLPSASFVRGGEGGGDSFIILASEETEMHWPPETDGGRDGEKKERESILGEGLDGGGPRDGLSRPQNATQSNVCLSPSSQGCLGNALPRMA